MTKKVLANPLILQTKLSRMINILTIFGFILLAYRMFAKEEVDYTFLAWNLLLAAVPVIFAYLAARSTNKFIVFILIVIWLLFYPNAPYIITDYIHVGKAYSINFVIYDTILVTVFSLNAVLLGYISLDIVLNTIGKHLSKFLITPSLTIISVLTAYGLYMGRVLRFNSWEIMTNPIEVLNKINETLFHKNINLFHIVLILGFTVLHIYTFKLYKKIFS